MVPRWHTRIHRLFACKMNRDELLAQLEKARPQLLKMARLQLRNDAWAEDVVSDTIVTAIEKLDAFEGRSQFRTWVVAILKHKILDLFRRAGREVALPDVPEDSIDEEIFLPGGGFREPPRAWADPQELVREHQFMAILDACVERMPTAQGRVFLMREWLGLDTAEICKDLGITTSNLFVTLHRARLRLRECIQVNWLEQAS